MLLSTDRNFLRRLVLFCLSVFCVSLALATPWPHEQSDVPADPAIRWGHLENGLRYAIRKNSEPAGRVYLVLQVAVGAVHEREDQRGYAHFIEHMMFRGTKNHPATSLVKFLQHEGLEMGADTSAFTNYTTTFYNLDLPQNSAEKIALGLSILRDFSDRAVIAKDEVKREAKVIESERRTRESSATHVGDALNEFLNPDTLVTKRSPIGLPESVNHATAQRLQEFYRTWYRPSRMTIIAVGDAEPELLERLIREQFASLQPATPLEPADPDLGLRTPLAEDFQARFFQVPTPGGISSILYSIAMVEPSPDSVARRREQLVQSAGFAMLTARLIELARKEPNDIGDVEAAWNTEFGLRRQAMIRVDSRMEKWRAGVRLGEQELRRALLHGFTASEVKLVAQSYRNNFEQAISTETNRTSQYIAQSIRAGLEMDFVSSGPRTDWEIAGPTVLNLTPEQCNQAFRAIWAPAHRRLAVIGHFPSPLGDRDLLDAYDESACFSFVTEGNEHVVAAFDYTDFGPPGAITSRKHDERIDVHSLTFANGVCLNLKRTDYEKNIVHLRLRLGRGMAAEPADQPGVGLIASGSYLAGGVGHYDNIELGRKLTGDTLAINFSVEEEGCYFNGYASPEKLERLLQVVAAFITDPAFRPEGSQNAISRLQSHYAGVMREPVEYLRSYCPAVMASGDSRYGLPPIAQIAQREPRQIEEWLRPMLARGSIELGLAGDLNVEQAIAIVARTLGNLPARQVEPPPDPARRPALPAQAIQQVWTLEGCETGKAAVRVYWPGVDTDDYHTSRQLEVLSEILNDRLRIKIREELGATYGPLQQVWGSEVWRNYGYILVEIETAPKMAERVATLTRTIATDLATKGITTDEFERVMEPRRANLRQVLRNNTYWAGHILSRMQEKPGRVDWPITRNSDYLTMRREDIEHVARRFLGDEHVYTFIARPK